MRRKARNSLIIVVLLVVILGVGFGVWKIFFVPKPLKIKDLEKAHITRPASLEEESWVIVFQSMRGEESTNLGDIIDNSNTFGATFNETADSPGAVRFYVEEAESSINIPAGYTVEITYDGGQDLTIYLPALKEEWNWLYVAPDGSTYYDKDLTQLAWSPDSAEPLRIKDLENVHIAATRSSVKMGWTFGFTVDDLALGSVRDNSNLFDDEMVCETTEPLKIEVFQRGKGMAVRAGDTLEITYDGGQSLIIFLPVISKHGSVLYVATDGSTYWDEALTQLAQSPPSKPDEETKNE